MPNRRFPAPWRADKMPGGYVVRDANGQALVSRDNEAEALPRHPVYRIGRCLYDLLVSSIPEIRRASSQRLKFATHPCLLAGKT
jgi:hypothetical protein